MQRWHLLLLLAAGAAVGALVAPSLTLRAPRTIGTLPAIPVSGDDALALSVAVDHRAVEAEVAEIRHVVVTVTARDTATERVPVDLALVVDTSCSMGQADKLAAARVAADELVGALRPGDRFSLVSFDDRARVLVGGALFDGDTERLRALIAGLREDGGTNLWDGLQAGRGELGTTLPARKVLVVSDGHANVGETEPAMFGDLARGWNEGGVSVSAIGLGRDFNERLLEGMADAGGGTYRFVGEPEELPAVIAAELARTTETVARRARVRVEVPEGARIREVFGWSAELTPRGADIHVGDLAAGQARKIVLAVEVPASQEGELALAHVGLHWDGLSGTRGSAAASAVVQVTSNAWAAARSVDEPATVAVARARAGNLTRASADAWRDGDAIGAMRLVTRASALIAEAQESSSAPELAADAARMAELERLGYAEGNAYAAKAASEAGRELAR